MSKSKNKAEDKTLKVTLRRSLASRMEKHRRVARTLGLRKLNQTVVVPDIPSTRGMINKISYLLEVEETE